MDHHHLGCCDDVGHAAPDESRKGKSWLAVAAVLLAAVVLYALYRTVVAAKNQDAPGQQALNGVSSSLTPLKSSAALVAEMPKPAPAPAPRPRPRRRANLPSAELDESDVDATDRIATVEDRARAHNIPYPDIVPWVSGPSGPSGPAGPSVGAAVVSRTSAKLDGAGSRPGADIGASQFDFADSVIQNLEASDEDEEEAAPAAAAGNGGSRKGSKLPRPSDIVRARQQEQDALVLGSSATLNQLRAPRLTGPTGDRSHLVPIEPPPQGLWMNMPVTVERRGDF